MLVVLTIDSRHVLMTAEDSATITSILMEYSVPVKPDFMGRYKELPLSTLPDLTIKPVQDEAIDYVP